MIAISRPRRSALRTMAMSRSALGAVVAMAALVMSAGSPHAAQGTPTLRIGITLHPYYSWTRNIVGALPGYEIRSILPGEIDAGDYQPRPDDIKKLVDLDAIVVNGIGHDDFILPMLKASGNKKVVVIRPNEMTPQIHAAHGGSVGVTRRSISSAVSTSSNVFVMSGNFGRRMSRHGSVMTRSRAARRSGRSCRAAHQSRRARRPVHR